MCVRKAVEMPVGARQQEEQGGADHLNVEIVFSQPLLSTWESVKSSEWVRWASTAENRSCNYCSSHMKDLLTDCRTTM